MANLESILNNDASVSPEDFALKDHEPIYTENIDQVIAKTLVGPAYKDSYTYKLITQASSATVAMFDKTGKLVDEVELKSESLVSTLSDVNQSRLLRSDLPPVKRKEYDLYEVKDDKKGYIIPIVILLSLLSLGSILLFITLKYLI